MRPRLEYNLSLRIWLHLEDYHNAGLTSDETKKVIESVRDSDCFGSGLPLSCRPMGINGNWIVDTHRKSSESIADLVDEIRWNLDQALIEKKEKGKVARKVHS